MICDGLLGVADTAGERVFKSHESTLQVVTSSWENRTIGDRREAGEMAKAITADFPGSSENTKQVNGVGRRAADRNK